MKPSVTVQFSGLTAKCMNCSADWILHSQWQTGWRRIHMNRSNVGWMRIGRSVLHPARIWNVCILTGLNFFFNYDNLVMSRVSHLCPGADSFLAILILIELKLVSVWTHFNGRLFANVLLNTFYSSHTSIFSRKCVWNARTVEPCEIRFASKCCVYITPFRVRRCSLVGRQAWFP